ncbi:MAG: LPS-assembly protein LptD [Bacteroidetes bacterium]|nr:LPS-assembly protein LptD [Bacteroidota bacterium]
MTKRPINKVFFFVAVLISLIPYAVNAQTQPQDSLKKVSVDTLSSDDNESLESRISYFAEDSTVFMAAISKVFLYGNAHVEYESMNLKAEFIEIDYSKNTVTAYGKKDSVGKNVGSPLFKDGIQEMSAEKIMYNLKSKKGKIFNATTKQGELLVFGKEIKKDSNNVIYLKDMRCIPCEAEDARTVFKASHAKIIPNDKIVTGPMFLEIGGVPTPLGLPFGYFPNTKKQHNGILLPQFGNSSTLGYNLRDGGFYWGINDKTDMIIRGDIYANGSWALKTTNNYLAMYKASGSVNLSYSRFNIGDRDIPLQFANEKSYTVKWVHNQDNKNNPSVRFSANVNYVNNQRINRLNALNSGQFLQNTFQSNINYTKSFKGSSLSLNATHNQNSIAKTAEVTFPALTYNINRFYPFKRENAVKQNVLDKIGVNYLLEARNTLSGGDSTLFNGNLEKKLKYGIKHSLPISTNFNVFKYITVTPAINLSSVMYTKSTRKSFIPDFTPKTNIKTDTVSGFVGGYDANFTTALNTKVFFDYAFRKGKVKQIRHLLIPTLTYSYRPDFGEEQYGFWKKVQVDTTGRNFQRYSIFDNTLFGGPAPGKTNALGINLNNNIEAKIRKATDTGFVYNKTTLIQNISLNTNYNFAADSFKMSLIGISARTKLFRYFDVVANTSLDPYGYDKTTKKRSKEFSYNSNQQAVQFKNANLAVNTSFGSNQLEAMRKTRQPPNMTNGAEPGAIDDVDKQEKLPWNVNVYYNLTLDNFNYSTLKPIQTLNFSGDIAPTKFWKLGITSGFDFTNKRISYTSLNIYRDMKCWEARIDWVPFGIRKSYYLTINLKSSMLRDFKIPRRSLPIDNF